MRFLDELSKSVQKLSDKIEQGIVDADNEIAETGENVVQQATEILAEEKETMEK